LYVQGTERSIAKEVGSELVWEVTQNKVGEVSSIQIMYGFTGHGKGLIFNFKCSGIWNEGFNQGSDVICWNT
jgi:hypothetical protein